MFEQEQDYSLISLLIFVFFSLFFIVSCVAAQDKIQVEGEQERYKLAADYSTDFRGLSVLVIKGDKVVFEEYQNGFKSDESQLLASGTKSFSGVMAAAAIEDGLIKDFDEKVLETITEWKTDKQKSKITIRQLLSLTSGIESGGLGRPPAYSDSVTHSIKYDPGTTFNYGPVPFQVFGEVTQRKLLPKKESVLDYLNRRIFNPIGLKYSNWNMQHGQPNLPSGAYLSAAEWAKFGIFLKNEGRWNGKQIISKKLLQELYVGSKANLNYGLTFWLNRSSGNEAKLAEPKNARVGGLMDRLDIQSETDEVSQYGFGENFPKDMYVAAGAGKQRLYIIPSMDMVIVRQGRVARFDDRKFLNLLLFGKSEN